MVKDARQAASALIEQFMKPGQGCLNFFAENMNLDASSPRKSNYRDGTGRNDILEGIESDAAHDHEVQTSFKIATCKTIQKLKDLRHR